MSAKATARAAFEAVGTRLQVDPALLAYLFKECLDEVLAETKASASCTLRGVGKFRVTTTSQLLNEAQGGGDIMVFERTKHQLKNTPFAALQLAKRVAKGAD